MKQDLSRRGWPRVLLAACALLASLCALADVAVPPLKARVTDLTSTLSSEQKQTLEQTLAAFEARKGSQIAVLIVPTTQPETVEQYAVRVEETWKLGRKGIDDGVLLVVAKNDRKLRIEVGYGLEGVLPDATAKRIIEEEIVPRFKQGDFYGGISAGLARMVSVIDGEALPAPKSSALSRQDEDLLALLFYGLIAAFLFGGLIRLIFGRLLGSGITGIAAGVITYMLAGAFAAAIMATVAFLVNLFGKTPDHPILGGSAGGWSSSGGSWSSSGDSGFSGGGGSSGGGGASGSW